jgi:amidase
MDDYQLGVVDALAAIDAGRLTRADYLESCIARTLAVEPTIHAFAHFDAAALRPAQVAAGGPLAGIPIGLKDIIDTRGMPTERGSAAFVGRVPDTSAWVVDRLVDAGAVIFGKTVTTEFAWRHPGATCNPWNPAHTPGGSSSGSAAAVAAGCVPVALGTQTLGSVLRPAAFCGVVGYKPSFGAIPREGVYPLADSLDHIGVFARHVADAAFVVARLTDPDGRDAPREPPPWPLRAAVAAPRIAWLRTVSADALTDEQRDLVSSVVGRLEADGAIVVPIELPPIFDQLRQAALTICDVEGATVNAALAAERPPRISAHTIALVERGSAVRAVDYVHARRTQRDLIRHFAAILQPYDAALLPPALGTAPHGQSDTGDAVYCTPASLLGAPAIALPAGRGANGLPLGIQLVNAWGTDRRLLETALWVERALQWPVAFPTLRSP